jgi:hypothetical protein
MMENLFCQQVPPPPPNLPAGGTPGPNETRREALEAAVSAPACLACHTLTDPPGYSLEHFDAQGNYRDIDNGKPVDSSGTISSPVMLTFSSIDTLAPQLATSCTVAHCFSNSLMTDAFAAATSGAAPTFTEEEINHVGNVFANSGFSIRALVKAIVETPSFLQ